MNTQSITEPENQLITPGELWSLKLGSNKFESIHLFSWLLLQYKVWATSRGQSYWHGLDNYSKLS